VERGANKEAKDNVRCAAPAATIHVPWRRMPVWRCCFPASPPQLTDGFCCVRCRCSVRGDFAVCAAVAAQVGKTPLDYAKFEAMRAAFRTAVGTAPAAAPAAAVTTAKQAVCVPADVASLLAGLSLSEFGPALCSELGLRSVAAAALITDADLQAISMKPLDRRTFLAAASQQAGGSKPAAAAPAAALQAAPSAGSSTSCDVMISYRVPETGEGGDNSVFYLQKALVKRGFSVFVGEGAIQGGDEWPDTISNGVRNCKAFVVLCSRTYGDTVWTKREIVMADNLQKPLIPVYHSGVYPPPAVEIYLGGKQRIPGGTFSAGYVAANISHDKVVEGLVEALARAGVQPGARAA
jgi:hypothetical protein